MVSTVLSQETPWTCSVSREDRERIDFADSSQSRKRWSVIAKKRMLEKVWPMSEGKREAKYGGRRLAYD